MLLYVTSFAEDMYNASGKGLIDSFYSSRQIGELLICYEGFDLPKDLENKKNKNIILYSLDEDKVLEKWLDDYKNYIPEYLGGTAKEKDSPHVFTPPNRKASRWFRKVASLYYAYQTYRHEYSTIVWVDCDCVFKKTITMDKYINLFSRNYGVFFYLGNKRFRDDKGVESGFIGFYKENGGFDLIRFMMEDLYQSGKYLKYIRWDDGYMFRIAISLNLNIPAIDIANKSNVTDVINEPGRYFSEYVSHNKGTHRLQNILV